MDEFTYDEEIGPGYYVRIPSAFLRHKGYSPEAKVLYGILLSYAGSGEKAWPGQNLLCEHMGCTKNTLRKALDHLIERGLVLVTRRGRGQPNSYHVKKLIPDQHLAQEPQNSRSSKFEHQEQEAQNLNIKNVKISQSRSSKIEPELYSSSYIQKEKSARPVSFFEEGISGLLANYGEERLGAGRYIANRKQKGDNLVFIERCIKNLTEKEIEEYRKSKKAIPAVRVVDPVHEERKKKLLAERGMLG